jgi:hypothetical protein
MRKKELNIYIDRMKECLDNPDIEMAHVDADDLLVSLLRELGYQELADIYENVNKWYA